ncbi:MAG: hypothetical protein KA185_16145 [Vitreoscilla sp.]|nr:hypothetical protein [Vitreoscilla sp.]
MTTSLSAVDWTAPRTGRLPYTYANFAHAKLFLFGKWCEVAAGHNLAQPTDLSGACKYGSLFMQGVFGGELRGHYEHQYNFIAGRLVDLSHDAADVGRMRQPYLHEPDYFAVPELQAALELCLLRTDAWAAEFVGLRGDCQS